MRLLKAIVIGTAFLIVIGVGVLIWGVAHHWNNLAGRSAVAVPPAASGPAASSMTPSPSPDAGGLPGAPITTEIAAPDGMHLEQMLSTQDRLLLRFAGPQGDRILVVDPKSGRVTAGISVVPSAR